ncbi:hypothetical protein GYMLUDRAFT_57610 [Collybiopsis luxurians FD-317 M1]|uniref:Malate dehydrogenase n=1 Tax=Collybiopsis luxurians FD-317 M1 TaxID=944289 RepID=A0A0D0BHD1_9AGAR|nr:hypothetical protein GYMLUDRAFT_57610 [Collybiopsis luxurians FD-317 M1]
MFFKSIIVLASFASASMAAPATATGSSALCDVSSATLSIPSGVALPAPDFKATFLGLGVGTQNYTCTSGGTYTNVGAYAEVYQLCSGIYKSPIFEDLTSLTFAIWSNAPSSVSASELIELGEILDPSFILGEHYFVTNPVTGSGLAPKWDFTSHAFAGNPAAYVVGSKVTDVPAPTSKSDIDWLELTNLTGTLANEIYRVETRGGQPPASCVPGSPEIYIRYTALYWFMGGSF